ncbi:MAG: AMP-binding protein [Sphingopyxis sp.]|nr:AMP-binding protein [Sphingopyxis sp.]
MAFGLGTSLTQTAALRGDAMAIVDDDKIFSWRQFEDRVARLAGAFVHHGLSPGGRVVLLTLNGHRSIESFYAVCWAGGVVVPLNHRLSSDELVAQVRDSAPDIIILGDEFTDLAGPLSAAAGTARLIHAGEGQAPPGLLSFERELARARPCAEQGRACDDLACIFYTSGTTSAAKGVMLSHANLDANSVNTRAELGLGRDTIHLHHGPLFHIGSAARLFSVTAAGGTHVFLPRFDPGQTLAEIARTRVTHATFVPTMIRALLDEPSRKSVDLTSLALLSYGSAPMPLSLLVEMMNAFPDVRFVQSYGMTELSPVATMLGADDHASGRSDLLRSAGRAVPLADIAIVAPDGRRLDAGDVGEIIVRGPNVMTGYWNRPDLTTAAIENGWMHTGDAGYLDREGYLFVVDRLKDMIISGGENIFSQEVENVVSAHPAVAQCAVIGLPDSYWGEVVHCIVALKPGVQTSPDEIISFSRAHLAHYKCPRAVTIYPTSLPLSGANKIAKAQLRAELMSEHVNIDDRRKE